MSGSKKSCETISKKSCETNTQLLNEGREIEYSYLDIPGFEEITDDTKRHEIAIDIQTEIQKFMYKHHFPDTSYDVSVEGCVCIFYISGPTEDDIVKQINVFVRNIFHEQMEGVVTRLFKYLRAFVFFS